MTTTTAYIPAADLAPDRYAWACTPAADLAFEQGRPVIVLGVGRHGVEVSTNFAHLTPTALVVMPDVVLAELAANGHDIPTVWALQRDDGRTAAICRAPRSLR